ncbi:MAG: hypothetical protein HC930_09770 [Hydrococcus sp. SU_1_0]|nr:hypothetical protein [Hydrococcus sp. SU_1_0]
MNTKPKLSSNLFIQEFKISFQPAPAWTAIFGVLFLTSTCIAIGAGNILNIIFPLGATAVGLFFIFSISHCLCKFYVVALVCNTFSTPFSRL